MDVIFNYEGKVKIISIILSGYIFVIIGVLFELRSYFVKLIEEYSGNVFSVILSKISYLLVGFDVGSKLEKVYKIGIKVINEE